MLAGHSLTILLQLYAVGGALDAARMDNTTAEGTVVWSRGGLGGGGSSKAHLIKPPVDRCFHFAFERHFGLTAALGPRAVR